MRAIGYTGPGRDGDALGMMDFALSADDLTAYAAGTVTEPASVAMLRFVVWLLVAPHGALGALLTTGTGSTFERLADAPRLA